MMREEMMEIRRKNNMKHKGKNRTKGNPNFHKTTWFSFLQVYIL